MLCRKHCQRKEPLQFTSSSSKAELILPGTVVGWDLARGTKVSDHGTVTAALHLSRNKSKECPGCICHAPNESFSASESTANRLNPFSYQGKQGVKQGFSQYTRSMAVGTPQNWVEGTAGCIRQPRTALTCL